MPNVSPIQSSFKGGEISPLCYGLVQEPRYKESLAICKNYIPLLQGPITRRPGTRFVFPVKDSSAKTRLIPFQFSTTQSYMIEFGNLYCRFYKNNALITNTAKDITAITQANPAVVTSASHGFSNGDKVLLAGIVGVTELNNREFTVANTTMNTFELSGIDSTSFTAYSSAGTASKIYEVVTPYTTAQLFQIQYTQSNDVLYLVNGSHAPAQLTRTADTSWTFTSMQDGTLSILSMLQDGPYYDENIVTGTTLTPTHYTAAGPHYWYLVASSTSDINDGQGFLSTDVGRFVRLYFSATTSWDWVVIYQVDDTLTARVNFPNTNMINSVSHVANVAVADWRLGFYSSTDGWPSTVTFHQDRLVFGGAGGDPTRFDGSNASDYVAFAPTDQAGTVAASHSYDFPLSSNDVNSIDWMTSDEQGLVLGTTGGEWVVTAADPNSALSALSVSAKRSTSHGSAPVQAYQSGKCSIFVQRDSRKVRELNYYFDVNGFRAADLTQMAEHITASGITQLAVQKSPQPIVWAVRTDGVLLAMTYERDLDALKVGWSRHILGGAYSGGDAVVESVAVIPSADGFSEDVWVIVKRTVNGATVRYVEYITPLFDSTTDLEDAVFVDSSLTYDSTSTSTISGLNHLNGQTVSVLADGSVQADKGVVNGRITLDTAASVVTIGLSYNSDGQKLRNDAGSADGTAMGKTRRTHRVGMMLLNTLGLKLGADFDSLDDIALDSADDGNFDEAIGLYSGIMSELVTTDYDFDNMICWRQSQPLPGTIQGFYPQMVTQDRS